MRKPIISTRCSGASTWTKKNPDFWGVLYILGGWVGRPVIRNHSGRPLVIFCPKVMFDVTRISIIGMVVSSLVGGFNQPIEKLKNISPIGLIGSFPWVWVKIKHLWNHPPSSFQISTTIFLKGWPPSLHAPWPKCARPHLAKWKA